MDAYFRFDDVVRSERYFTATLLPAVLLHGDFGGIAPFLELVEQRTTTERDRDSHAHPKRSAPLDWSREALELITEFHIARDLAFYRKHLGTVDVSSAMEERAAPDLVVVLRDTLLVVEAKFFHATTYARLNHQLSVQRQQITQLLHARPALKYYRHVVLVPGQLGYEPECDAVLKWDEIVALAHRVLGSAHYVTARFEAALGYFDAIVGDPREPNYDGIESVVDVLARCRARGAEIQVGHIGGIPDLEHRSDRYLLEKPWKWRNPAINKGRITQANWVRGDEFVKFIHSRFTNLAHLPVDDTE